VSTIDELANGAFAPVIPEVDDGIADARRVVLCSGKLYYELVAERRERRITDVAIVRVERLYPIPGVELRAAIDRFPGAELVWAQEEPRNMGAWPMYDEWLRDLFGDGAVRYAGRPAAAATATGFPQKHAAQQSALIDDALR